MRIAWVTDPHLNHCSLPVWERLVAEIVASGCDRVLITGDISEGEDVVFQLLRFADVVSRPIDFVLGNHDFYHSSIDGTRTAVAQAASGHPWLCYLRDESVISFNASVSIVGEDGWGDATEGDYDRSRVLLNDFRLIDDFYSSDPQRWRRMLRELGADAAVRLAAKLRAAALQSNSVLVATHVPPFREACWYDGHTTDDNWAPFFVCGQVGTQLRVVASEFPETDFQVVCGHTHHGGFAKLAPNLSVTTGPATYAAPSVTEIIDVDDGIKFEDH